MPSALAALGVGGIGFDPLTVLTELWIADDFAANSDGDTITNWVGKSGTARTLTQATAGKRPTKQTDTSKPVVRFDGVDDFLNVGFTQTQPAAWFIVMRFRSAIASGTKVFLAGANGFDVAFYHSATNVILYAGTVMSGPAHDESLWTLAYAEVNGASGAIRVDGGTATTGSIGSTNPNGIRVGSDAFGNQAAGIDVRAIGHMGSIPSAADRQALESYFTALKP